MPRNLWTAPAEAEWAAFTLIELLTVLAVIAVLLALLLPAVRRSQNQAQRIRCIANLRQLGIAAHLYWDENDDRAFRYRRAGDASGDLYWFGWLERGPEGTRAFDPSQGALSPYLEPGTVELCPALNYALGTFKLKATGAAYGYGYNLQLSAPRSQPPVRVAAIPTPARIVLLADAAQVNTFQPPASPDNPMLEEFYYVNTNEATVHFRHGRRANLLFVDGHVGQGIPLAGSIDPRLPRQCVGQIRPELLLLNPP